MRELDLNPIFCYSDGLVAVDARVVLEDASNRAKHNPDSEAFDGGTMGIEIDYLFHPRSIAVAGASESPDKTGHTYFKNVLENFKGKSWPINFRASEVLGVPTFRSVRDLPEDVDYVISAIPNRDIIDLVEACVSKNAKVLHLFTARFSETGFEKETQLEYEMLEKARAGGLRIIGPNCMGLYYPKEGIAWGRDFPA